MNKIIVSVKENNKRFDVACKLLLPQYSRSMLSQAIIKGYILLNKKTQPTKKTVNTGDVIEIIKPLETINNTDDTTHWKPQKIPLNIIYEDNYLIVLNKPRNCVVHPGAKNTQNTLAQGLLFKYPNQCNVERAGVVHRLDKDTTGLLIFAKTNEAHLKLTQCIKNHTIQRTYHALVWGACNHLSGTIQQPIGRCKANRLKKTIDRLHGRNAITHYKTRGIYGDFSHLELQLETGRTHQIRVHTQAIGHPVLGDPLYRKNSHLKHTYTPETQTSLLNQKHQLLHAIRLKFNHPITGNTHEFECPLPTDFSLILKQLQADFKP